MTGTSGFVHCKMTENCVCCDPWPLHHQAAVSTHGIKTHKAVEMVLVDWFIHTVSTVRLAGQQHEFSLQPQFLLGGKGAEPRLLNSNVDL